MSDDCERGGCGGSNDVVILVRHGEKRFANGRGFPLLDPPLCNGAAASAVAAMVNDIIAADDDSICGAAGKIVTAVVSSPFRRARDTAAAIAATQSSSGIIKKTIIEIDTSISEYLGHWQRNGRSNEVLFDEATVAAFDDAADGGGGGSFDAFFGETRAELTARAIAAVDRLRARCGGGGGITVAVSHKFVIETIEKVCAHVESVSTSRPMQCGGAALILRFNCSSSHRKQRGDESEHHHRDEDDPCRGNVPEPPKRGEQNCNGDGPDEGHRRGARHEREDDTGGRDGGVQKERGVIG